MTIGLIWLLPMTAAHAETLHLTIDKLKPDHRPVIIYICAEQEFLQSTCRYNFIKSAKDERVTIIWDDAPPGQWAVVLYHDEDDNGKMKRRFGLPQEGYGFSRITGVILKKPKFADAQFEILPEQTAEVTVAIRY